LLFGLNSWCSSRKDSCVDWYIGRTPPITGRRRLMPIPIPLDFAAPVHRIVRRCFGGTSAERHVRAMGSQPPYLKRMRR
jgi:hypothetical protein